jgi:uncharacterized protein (DUF58 family)
MEPDTSSAPGGKKRVMGGKPVLPKVLGRPVVVPEETEQPIDRPLSEIMEDGETWTEVVRGISVDPAAEPPKDAVHFEHGCCQAVRPHPEEADETGVVQKQEARQEPYLTWQGPLKPTARFGLAILAAGVLGLAATVLGLLGVTFVAWALAGLAGVLVLFLILTFFMTNSAVKNIDLHAQRHIIEPKIERGKLFHARLDTTGTTIPGLIKVEISDQHAPGIRPVERPALDGAGRIHYRVRPQGRGLVTFSGLDVRAEDVMGLWVAEQEWRLRTTIEVDPSLPAVAWKARVTGYAPFDNSTPKAIVSLYRDVEYEDTRPFAPGDRMRDIDWKYMAKRVAAGQSSEKNMIVRKRYTDPDTTLLLVLDVGQSMLQDQAGYRNLDLAAELAQEFADAALKRNHETGFLAYNEDRILDHVRPTRSKIQFKKILKHLQHIADHHLPEEGEEPLEILIAGDPENLRLGFGYGLRQRSTAAMTVLVFSDLQTTPEEIVQSIAKAASSGQKVVVMLMPGPKLRAVRTGRVKEEEDMELRGEHHTNRMRELLIANGCEFVEVNPSEDDFKLEVPVPPELAE